MHIDKDTINGLVQRISSDEGLLQRFQENPAEAIRAALPDNLPVSSEDIEGIIEKVQQALAGSVIGGVVDKAAGVLGGLFNGGGTPGQNGDGTPTL